MQAVTLETKPSILFVDDERSILNSIKRVVRPLDWNVTFVTSGEEALELMANESYAVVVSDMRMPGMNGSEFLAKVKELQPFAVRVLLSGYADIHDVRDAVNNAGIFNYLPKPWCSDSLVEVIEGAIELHEQQVEEDTQNKKTKAKSVTLGKIALILDKKAKERDIEVDQALTLVDCIHTQMQSRFKDSVKVLNQIIDWKEGRDTNHTKFVMKYAERIANELELGNDVDDILTAATLHRVGLVGLPDKFSVTPYFRLNKEEKAMFDTYPVLSEAALASADSLKGAAKLIRHQKEHANGTGKPDGLNYRQIPVGSQIICLLSDFYELANGKLEQNISGIQKALEYIELWLGKKYCQPVYDVFIRVFDRDCELLECSRLIRSGDFESGMVLEQDIVSSAGAVLVSSGTELTSVIIQKIISLENEDTEYLISDRVSQSSV